MTRTSRAFRQCIKRVIDVAVASVLLLGLAPLLGLMVVILWWRIGRPVFFIQERPGLKGQPFRIFKFRTMSDERDVEGNLLPDDIRLGKLGKFIRSTSLDELPQLINVLTGKMSLVGPRPLLMDYLPLYSQRQAMRHDMRPGITGYAQVNGRNEVAWAKRLELDVWYVENWSLWLDLKIFVDTILVVIRRKGVSQTGRATVERFRGETS